MRQLFVSVPVLSRTGALWQQYQSLLMTVQICGMGLKRHARPVDAGMQWQ